MSSINKNWLWLLGFLLVLVLGYFFADILTYILLAWVLSMLGQPVKVFLQHRIHIRRWHLGPGGAAILTILSFYLLLVGIMLLFVPTMVEQTRNLAGVDYTALGQKLQQPFANLDARLHHIGLLESEESLATRLQTMLSSVFKPTMLGDFVESFIATAGNVVVTITAVTFILFFFLKDDNLFTDWLRMLVPTDLEEKVLHAVEASSKMLTRYFGGLITQIASFTTTLSLLLWLLGIDNALLIGAFGGIFNVVPYVGPIFGMVFACFITVSSHLDLDFNLMWPMLLKVAGAFGVTQFIDNNFLGPAIFSKSVQAHPLEIFLVTLVAAKLGGVLGMVLGIPVYTVLRVIARVFFSEFKLIQKLTGSMDEVESV